MMRSLGFICYTMTMLVSSYSFKRPLCLHSNPFATLGYVGRISKVLGVDERFFDSSCIEETEQLQGRVRKVATVTSCNTSFENFRIAYQVDTACFVICTRASATTKWLLTNDCTCAFGIDVEVTSCLFEPASSVREDLTIFSEATSTQKMTSVSCRPGPCVAGRRKRT